jgi:hypothetical protein
LSKDEENQANQGIGTDLQQDVKQRPVSFIPVGQIQGERLVWQRNLSRGIIHRHVTIQERITNIRILQYNVETDKLISQVALKDQPDVVVTNSRRSSESLGSGVYTSGVYTGRRTGTSRSIGDVLIMKDGVIYTKLSNVVDPQGVRQIINTLKQETAD